MPSSGDVPTFTLELSNYQGAYVYVPVYSNGAVTIYQATQGGDETITNAVAGGFITIVNYHNYAICGNGLSEFAYSESRGSSGLTVVRIASSLAGYSTTLEIG